MKLFDTIEGRAVIQHQAHVRQMPRAPGGICRARAHGGCARIRARKVLDRHLRPHVEGGGDDGVVRWEAGGGQDHVLHVPPLARVVPQHVAHPRRLLPVTRPPLLIEGTSAHSKRICDRISPPFPFSQSCAGLLRCFVPALRHPGTGV